MAQQTGSFSHTGLTPQRWLAAVGFYLAVGVWIIVPGCWTVAQAFKQPRDVHSLRWIPWLEYQPTLASWRETLADPQLRRTLRNSVIVSVGATTLALLLGCPAAYALARFRLRPLGAEDTLLVFLSQRFLPPVVVAVPLALMAQRVGLYDRLVALIVVHTAFVLPLVVLITRSAFLDVPPELEQAARLDGCTMVGAFVRVALPLAAPGVAAAGLIAFGFSWNEFVAALMLTQYRAQTLPLFVASSEDTWGLDMGRVAVRCLIAVLPPLAAGVAVQRFFIRGLTLGAVKG